MSYGFQVTNTAGRVIIDSEGHIPVLIASGTFSSASTTITYSNTTEIPIVFVKYASSTHFVACSSITTTSTTLSVYAYSSISSNPSSSTSGGTVAYRVYANVRHQSPSSSFGLQVFASNGYKIFDSTKTLLKIAGMINSVYTTVPPSGDTNLYPIRSFTIPNGLTSPWFLCNGMAQTVTHSAATTYVQPWRLHKYIMRTNGADLQVATVTTSYSGSTWGPSSNPQYTYSHQTYPINVPLIA